MSELDVTEYDAAVTHHALDGAARARMLDDLLDGEAWTADLTRGTVTFGSTTYRVDMLGTVAADQSFLWAWANPSASQWERSLHGANVLHRQGDAPGWAVFSQRKVMSDWVPFRELAWVSGELLGTQPVRFLPAGNGALAIVAFRDVEIDIDDLPLAYLPGLVLAANEVAGNRMQCVGVFLRQRGFTVTRSSHLTLQAVRGESSLQIEFSEDDRVTNVTGNL